MAELSGAPGTSATASAGRAVPDIRLVGLVKRFGEFAAVDGVDLDVAAGEFFTLLGPSGSGKTTTLRIIAGFELPDAGRVELAGRDVAALPPYARDVNTVFQDYALFPHSSRRPRAARSATFTAGGQETLPIWILTNLSRPNQLPIVNVVALMAIALSLLPVYLAQRLTADPVTAAAPGAEVAAESAR